jgi:hypothetical protein
MKYELSFLKVLDKKKTELCKFNIKTKNVVYFLTFRGVLATSVVVEKQ